MIEEGEMSREKLVQVNQKDIYIIRVLFNYRNSTLKWQFKEKHYKRNITRECKRKLIIIGRRKENYDN